MSDPLTPAEVAEYLQSHPQFFEQYAEQLAEIRIPHPHGGRTIALSERQLLSLREKNRTLLQEREKLLQFGEANDALSEKMHRFAVALTAAETVQAVLHLVSFHLCGDFTIPRVALRVWAKPLAVADQAAGLSEEFLAQTPEFSPVQDSLKSFAETLTKPYCGPVGEETRGFLVWFGEAGMHIRSQALIALRNAGGAMGMIALGSEEIERFYPDMGTLYLERLGELVSAALSRCAGGVQELR